MRQKILVVDDEPAIVEILETNLQRSGFDVISAGTGREALEKLRKDQPHLVLLDLMLPDTDGFEVAREIREMGEIPIIMVTAKGEDVDRILGLETGADDYIVKPFNPREVVARIHAILRRLSSKQEVGKIESGNLVIDPLKRRVYVEGNLVDLSPKEFDILYFFASNPVKVVSREELLQEIWGTSYIDSRTVDVHVKHIRQKCHDEEVIRTVWGRGYRFKEES